MTYGIDDIQARVFNKFCSCRRHVFQPHGAVKGGSGNHASLEVPPPEFTTITITMRHDLGHGAWCDLGDWRFRRHIINIL